MQVFKKIKLKNFKSIREAEIEIKPLTLIYGPNSSGKSSILKAMSFMRKSVKLSDALLQPVFRTEDLRLGDFKNSVYGKDLDKSIELTLSYSLSSHWVEASWRVSYDHDSAKPVTALDLTLQSKTQAGGLRSSLAEMPLNVILSANLQ